MPSLPLSLSDICALACEPSLLPRVRAAIAIVAQEVIAEDSATPGYPLRWSLARTILSPTEAQAASMMVGLVVTPDLLTAAAGAASTDPATMATAITDQQIIDAVRGGWGAVAGVNPRTAAESVQATT